MRYLLKRTVIAVFLFLMTVGGVVGWEILASIAPLEARYTHDQCRRIALRDAATGRVIVGVEDIARLPDGTLLLSAHDRLDPDQPDGGIYALDPAHFDRVYDQGTDSPINLVSVVSTSDIKGGLRPHGIAVNETGDRLGFINRGREGIVSIEIFMREVTHGGGGWKPLVRRTDPRWCRANDLDFSNGADNKVIVTLDRESCSVSVTDMIGLFPTGEIWMLDPKLDRIGGFAPQAMNRYRFPNGISGDWVAETRGKALANHATTRRRDNGKNDGESNSKISRISLQGGPDNLHRIDAEAISVALHPSLPRLGAYRYGWSSSAPSRAALVDLTSGATEILFDNPEGDVFAGATVAVLERDQLVLGSVRDEGVLHCVE